MLLEYAEADLKKVYQGMLDFNNLKIGEDVELGIRPSQTNKDAVLVVFFINDELLADIDPTRDAHRNLGASFVKFLERKMEPFLESDWLNIQLAIVNSDGEYPPAILTHSSND